MESPINCDCCGKGYCPDVVFTQKNRRKICRWCLREKIIKWEEKSPNKHFGIFLEQIFSEEEMDRFMIDYGVLGNKNLRGDW